MTKRVFIDSNWVKLPLTLTSVSVVLNLSLNAQAVTLKYGLNFQTTNQSIWGSGNGTSFADERFLGVSWDEGIQKTIVSEQILVPSTTLVPEVNIPSKIITPAKVIPAVYSPAIFKPAVYSPAKVIPSKVIVPEKCVKIPWVGTKCTPAVVTPEIRIPRKLLIPEIRIPPKLLTPEIRIPEVRTPAVYVPAVKSPEFKSPSVGVAASTKAKAGLDSKLKIEGGTVDSLLPINLFLEVPDGKFKPGETITIKSGFSIADGANFSTASPIASYILDLVFGLKANSGFKVGSNLLPIFDYNIPEQRVNFLNLSPQNASFSVPLGDVGSLKVKVPTVNTKGILESPNKLTAKGSDSFVEGMLDVDAVITKIFPSIPPLQGGFEMPVISKPDLSVPGLSTDDILKKLGIGNLDLSARAKYNLLDLTLGANLSLGQSFSLLVDSLTGKLTSKNGAEIPFKVGQDIAFTVPDIGGEGIFNLDAVVDLNATFSNKTSLGFDVNFGVLAGLLDIDPPFNVPGFKLGPLFDKNFELFKGDLASLYNKSFSLGGFSSQRFSLGIPVASVPTVPTPTPPSNPTPTPPSNPTPTPPSNPTPTPPSNPTPQKVPEPGTVSAIFLTGLLVSRHYKRSEREAKV